MPIYVMEEVEIPLPLYNLRLTQIYVKTGIFPYDFIAYLRILLRYQPFGAREDTSRKQNLPSWTRVAEPLPGATTP